MQQKIEGRKKTACFVHQLLERDKATKAKGVPNGLDGIMENEKEGEKADNHDSIVHSRLLTKKQLSDMAWGVRELSKKLAAIRLKLKVRTVFLLTKAHDEDLIGYTRGVTEWLLSKERETKYIVYVHFYRYRSFRLLIRCSYVEKTLENNHRFDAKGLLAEDKSTEGRLKYWTNDLCAKHPHTFDFVVTVGLVFSTMPLCAKREVAWW